MTAPFAIEPLTGGHDRASFSCGAEALDRYLAAQAIADQRPGASPGVTLRSKRLAGKSRAITQLRRQACRWLCLPALAKKLPRYPLVPGVRLGRLAVATVQRGKGLGAALLIDAIERSLRSEIVAFAMVVDAKDETAASFYRHHGFEAFASAPMNLYLPLGAVARRLAAE